MHILNLADVGMIMMIDIGALFGRVMHVRVFVASGDRASSVPWTYQLTVSLEHRETHKQRQGMGRQANSNNAVSLLHNQVRLENRVTGAAGLRR